MPINKIPIAKSWDVVKKCNVPPIRIINVPSRFSVVPFSVFGFSFVCVCCFTCLLLSLRFITYHALPSSNTSALSAHADILWKLLRLYLINSITERKYYKNERHPATDMCCNLAKTKPFFWHFLKPSGMFLMKPPSYQPTPDTNKD